jgi:hypothetical protein
MRSRRCEYRRPLFLRFLNWILLAAAVGLVVSACFALLTS